MHYKRSVSIPRSSLELVGEVEVGKYYALQLSEDFLYQFVHILEISEKSFTAETIYVGPLFYLDHIYIALASFIKKKEITSSAFRQAIDLFDNCKNKILSMEFDKTPYSGKRKIRHYYYFTNVPGNVITIGYMSSFDSKGALMIQAIEVDTFENSIVSWRRGDYDKDSKVLCFEIDPQTYEKTKKLHDMLEVSLITLMKSYLE